MKLQKRTSLVPLAGILCVGLFSTAVSADQPYRNTHQENKSHGKKQSGEYQRDSHKMITPEAGPKVSGGMDFFVSADYIYWRTNRLSDTWSVTNGIIGSSSTTLNQGAVQGTNWQPAHGWGSGFKVALGIDTSHDGFDVRAGYTWNRFNDTRTFNTNYLGDTNELNAIQAYAQLKNEQEGDFRYNKVDLELGRNFKLSPKLTLRPHAGLTGAWQRLDARFYQNAGDLGTSANGAVIGKLQGFGFPGTITTHQYTDAWGIGLRTGLNYFWMFIKEFGIYANLNANAIWMNLDEKTTTNVYNASEGLEFSDKTTRVVNHRNSSDMVVWVTEFETGLRYQTMFSDDNYGFMCQLGWEAQNWLNWTPGADLSFQGLNVKLRFDF